MSDQASDVCFLYFCHSADVSLKDELDLSPPVPGLVAAQLSE